jgi:hypothetical protein
MKNKTNSIPNSVPKVLVCRLVTNRKNYCTKELIDSSRSLSYKNCKVVHFDNSNTPFLGETLEWFGLNVVKTNHYQKELDSEGKKVSLPVREMMVRDMNMAREMVLSQGYDYMLILEQDIIPHSDIIEKLLSYNENIMSAFYWLDMNYAQIKGRDSWYTPINYYEFYKTDKGEIIPNIVFQPDPNKYFYPSRKISYAHAGFGCTLVSKNVLEKVVFRYDPTQLGQLDAFFYMDAIKEGFVPYLDTGLIVRHDHTDWGAEIKK